MSLMRYDIFSTLSKVGGRAVCGLDERNLEGLHIPLEGPIRGEIVLTNTGSCISARGHLQVALQMECARCLRPVVVKLDIDVNEECTLSQIDDLHILTADQVPVLDDTIVDLSELVRQMIELHAPWRVLCSEDCKGLCPRCGANLNFEQCQCSKDEIDPRLAALKHLAER